MYLIYKGLDLDKTRYTFPFTVIANQSISDGDWKTSWIKKKPTIPKGTILKITNMFQNYEGSWLVTEYEGFNFSVNPKYVSLYEE